MKRVLIAAVFLASIAGMSSSHADCTSANRGGSAGPYDTAGVAYGDLEVSAWTYGNFATGPAFVCSDGTTGTDTVLGNFEVKRDGVVVCTSNNSAFRITADPFGFGASITGTGSGCRVAISFDGISATPGVDPSDVSANADGANAGGRKDAPVKNHGEGGTSPSSVTIGSETIVIPNGTMGYFTKGVRAQSEH